MDLSVFPQGRKWRGAEQASRGQKAYEALQLEGAGMEELTGPSEVGHWPLSLSNHQAQHLAN